jgi:hypothetical protein
MPENLNKTDARSEAARRILEGLSEMQKRVRLQRLNAMMPTPALERPPTAEDQNAMTGEEAWAEMYSDPEVLKLMK